MEDHDMPRRCPWVDLSKPDEVAYHDLEWGVPVHGDETGGSLLRRGNE